MLRERIEGKWIDCFAEVFGPIAQAAEDAGLRVAFENWPGRGGDVPWHSVNLAWSPRNWCDMFDRVPSPALGLEFDPSHLVWQRIDIPREITAGNFLGHNYRLVVTPIWLQY